MRLLDGIMAVPHALVTHRNSCPCFSHCLLSPELPEKNGNKKEILGRQKKTIIEQDTIYIKKLDTRIVRRVLPVEDKANRIRIRTRRWVAHTNTALTLTFFLIVHRDLTYQWKRTTRTRRWLRISSLSTRITTFRVHHFDPGT